MRPRGAIPFVERQSRLHGAAMTFTVAALYRFAPFDDPAALRQPLLDLCAERGVKGTLLLAREGVNGTISGPADGIAAVIAHIRALPDILDKTDRVSRANLSAAASKAGLSAQFRHGKRRNPAAERSAKKNMDDPQ